MLCHYYATYHLGEVERPHPAKRNGGTIHLLKLWNVGSWAEGLPYCGDLDLVVQHVKKKGTPVPNYIMQSTIAIRAKNVRVYMCTPQENTSGVPFFSSQLIRSRENENWETNILSVKVDPLANRQHRRTDDLPLMRMSSSEFLINSTLIRIGRSLASVEILKKEWCEQLVLVPHWTRRGPNGLWVIRRGLNHPGVMKPTFLSQQIIPYI